MGNDEPGKRYVAQDTLDHPAVFETLPPTRRALLDAIKRCGEARAEDLAERLGITVSGVRQHLTSLEAQDLVGHREVKQGPGRPRHYFSLTRHGESLFPRRYGDFAHQMLEFLGEQSPDLVRGLFERRSRLRASAALQEIRGETLAERLEGLVAILDREGFLAEFEALTDGSFRLFEHNCALHDVALRYRQACTSEMDFLRQVLPNATVERERHIVQGDAACCYRIRPVQG